MVIFLIIIVFLMVHLFVAYKYRNQKKNIYEKEMQISYSYGLLIPCYNEEVVLSASLKNIEQIDYDNLEIIYINDGSTDQTLAILQENLKLKPISTKLGTIKTKQVIQTYQSTIYEHVYVIDKENGGKSDALNVGINFTTCENVITLDADSVLREDALLYINAAFQDRKTIAVGGNVVVAQCVDTYMGEDIKLQLSDNILENTQAIEYFRGFYVLKNSYAHFNALAIISGAFGTFNTDVMRKVNGFIETVGEDIDITIKFNRYALKNDLKIKYEDRAMCFTEAPNNWEDIQKQRIRWQKAFIDALKNNADFLLLNFWRNKLAFFMVIENFFIVYYSTLLTLMFLAIVLVDILTYNDLGIMFYILLTIGILSFVMYDITTFLIMKRSGTLKFDDIKLHQVINVLLYEFFYYRFRMIMIILYASIEYFFKPGGWNKVNRIGTIKNQKK